MSKKRKNFFRSQAAARAGRENREKEGGFFLCLSNVYQNWQIIGFMLTLISY